MNLIKLYFWGYTWEQFRGQIGQRKGILLVYKGIKDAEGFVVMKELVYIDYTSINELYENPVMDVIKKSMAPEEMLFYSMADVDERIAKEVLALLHGSVKSVLNEKVTVKSDLVIECSGKCDMLPHIINNQK